MIRNILLALIVAINLYFIIYFLRDLFKNKQNFKEEPGDMRLLPFTSFITFFVIYILKKLSFLQSPLGAIPNMFK